MRSRLSVGWLATVLLLASCSSGSDSTPAAPVEPLKPTPPFRHQALMDQLQENAEQFTFLEGDWMEDYGDAAFYGLAFYAHAGSEQSNAAWQQRADAAAERALSVIAESDILNGDVNEMIMSALGLVEHMDARDDRSFDAELVEFIDRLNGLVGLIGFYVTSDVVDSWAIDTYGPTSVSGLVGLVGLQYAHGLGGERRAAYVEWAGQMAQAIEAQAWNGSTYDFGGGRSGLFLYPNVTMILMNGRLYQLTGDPRYRDRAAQIYQGIQPLRLVNEDGATMFYRSPYSQEAMGAQTDEYSTLSSQNYLLFALQVLYLATGKAFYVEEADQIIDSIGERLLGTWCLSDVHAEVCEPACEEPMLCVVDGCAPDRCQGGVLHHWMDGRVALPSDPEFFCSGCNLQLLFNLWHRKERLE